jgi:hypothetical protein
MFALRGIYDGKSVQITDRITNKKRYKVVITFIEEMSEVDEELRDFSAQTDGMDFWDHPEEDIYQDFLTDKK